MKIITNGDAYSLYADEMVAFVPMQAFAQSEVVYSIFPSIWDGLSFDAKTGCIQGTPKYVAYSKSYTITASSGSDEVKFSFVISVQKSPKSIDSVDPKSIAQSRIALQFRGR